MTVASVVMLIYVTIALRRIYQDHWAVAFVKTLLVYGSFRLIDVHVLNIWSKFIH